MVFSILWQISHLRTWKEHYGARTRAKQMAMWCGIFFNHLVFIVILIFPYLLGTRWNIIMYFRPDFAIPLLTIGISLGVLGTLKIIRSKL
jgi:hypothetical protein